MGKSTGKFSYLLEVVYLAVRVYLVRINESKMLGQMAICSQYFDKYLATFAKLLAIL